MTLLLTLAVSMTVKSLPELPLPPAGDVSAASERRGSQTRSVLAGLEVPPVPVAPESDHSLLIAMQIITGSVVSLGMTLSGVVYWATSGPIPACTSKDPDGCPDSPDPAGYLVVLAVIPPLAAALTAWIAGLFDDEFGRPFWAAFGAAILFHLPFVAGLLATQGQESFNGWAFASLFLAPLLEAGVAAAAMDLWKTRSRALPRPTVSHIRTLRGSPSVVPALAWEY
jgi:hypothetical protein